MVAIILGTFHSHTEPDHISARNTLLLPILEQNRQIRAILSARRAVPDIDPDAEQPASEPTSEPVSEPTSDGSGEAPA